MPIYSYKCPSCEKQFDELRKLDERHTCPCECGATAKQKITPVRFDVLGMGVDPDFATFGDQWHKMKRQQTKKEEKSYREHGDYGARPGAD